MTTKASPARNLVLTIILAELRASIRGARRGDLAWVFIGGGGLLAYALGIVFLRIHARAEMIRDTGWIWWGALPAAMLLTGVLMGLGMARLTQTRAHAPFMKAQPLDDTGRRGMARRAAIILGLPLVALDGAFILIGALAAGADWAFLWAVGATTISMLGYVLAVNARLRVPFRSPVDPLATTTSRPRGLSIAWIDRLKPAWIGSWAGNYAGGHFRFTVRTVLIWLAFGTAGILTAIGSIVRGNATPATLGGVAGGVAIFVLAISCRPLLSPVLRASQLGFTRAVRGLARLPLLLSLAFFGALAVPAYAAEPGTLVMPLSGIASLLTLNLAYTAFAAFFAHSRRLATLAYLAALGLTAYEMLEYGRTVFLALAALVIFLWIKARSAYRHG